MLTNIETSIFYFLNRTCHSAVLDYVMIFITELGGSKFLFVLAVGLLFFKNKRVKATGILLLAGLMFSHYVVYFIKDQAARPRPFLVMTDVKTLFTPDSFSFPSGHAVFAFLTATIVTGCFRRRRISCIFYAAAFSVAVSRVYLGVHFPSDVLAGAGLGILIGAALVRIANSITS